MKPLPFRMRQETTEEKWRAETFWDKEPETLAWIDGFQPGDTFLDIGANIGIYSLYAAKKGIRTVAVEPHPGNFYALTVNTRFINRSLQVKAINACVGNALGMVTFRCDTKTAGTTGGGYTRETGLAGHVYCYTVADLDSLHGRFNHIKIDVDGEERDIVEGMEPLLASRSFDSCLIEIAPMHFSWIVTQFECSGYTRTGPLNFMSPHSRERRAKEGIEVENIIFERL